MIRADYISAVSRTSKIATLNTITIIVTLTSHPLDAVLSSVRVHFHLEYNPLALPEDSEMPLLGLLT